MVTFILLSQAGQQHETVLHNDSSSTVITLVICFRNCFDFVVWARTQYLD